MNHASSVDNKSWNKSLQCLQVEMTLPYVSSAELL